MTSIDTSKFKVGDFVNADGTKAKDPTQLGEDAFLKLLVAQLKNQTPDKPVDSTQMMQQEAMFSQLSAIQKMSAQTQQLFISQQSSLATGMLGQKITASAANGGADIVGLVTGVKLGTDGPVLKVGDMEVPIASVKEVTRTA